MINLYKEIMINHRIRFYPKQKIKFRDFIIKEFESLGYQNIQVDQAKNIIVGDLEKANTVFTAHYDTPMFSPYITPFTTIFGHILGAFISSIATIFVFFIIGILVILAVPVIPIILILYFPFIFLALTFIFPNSSNANDNTSGILAVLQMAKTLKECGETTSFAFILFNNEEWGLLGSKKLASNFYKKSGFIPKFLVVNFDCVGLGDKLLLGYKSDYSKQFIINASLECKNIGKKSKIIKSSILIGSDNLRFSNGVMVTMVKKSILGPFYLPRIHMPNDNVICLENVELCVQVIVETLNKNNYKEI